MSYYYEYRPAYRSKPYYNYSNPQWIYYPPDDPIQFTPRKRPPEYPDRDDMRMKEPNMNRRETDQGFPVPVHAPPVVTEEDSFDYSNDQMMSHQVSHFRVKPVVLDPYGKGGKKGDYVRQELINDRGQQEGDDSMLIQSGAGLCVFQEPIPQNIALPIADANGALSQIVFNSDTSWLTNWNSVQKLEVFKSRLGLSTPSYTVTSPFKLADVQNGNKLLALRNQFTSFTFKNLTKNDLGGGVNSESPLFCTVYFVQAKKDIFQEQVANYATLEREIVNGFVSYVHNVGAGTLSSSQSQPSYVTAKYLSSMWDDFKIVESRYFQLNSGQQCQMSVSLMKPQILSLKYKAKAQLMEIQRTTDPGTPADAIIYSPIWCKKGEIRMFIRMHAGVAPFGGSELQLEAGKLGVYAAGRFECFDLLDADGDFDRVTNNQSILGAQAQDLDADQVQGVP